MTSKNYVTIQQKYCISGLLLILILLSGLADRAVCNEDNTFSVTNVFLQFTPMPTTMSKEGGSSFSFRSLFLSGAAFKTDPEYFISYDPSGLIMVLASFVTNSDRLLGTEKASNDSGFGVDLTLFRLQFGEPYFEFKTGKVGLGLDIDFTYLGTLEKTEDLAKGSSAGGLYIGTGLAIHYLWNTGRKVKLQSAFTSDVLITDRNSKIFDGGLFKVETDSYYLLRTHLALYGNTSLSYRYFKDDSETLYKTTAWKIRLGMGLVNIPLWPFSVF